MAWGWTQISLAKALGSSQSIISEWEKDISRPSGASLAALAKLFDLPVKALETGKGFRIPEPPDTKPVGGHMSKRNVQDLKKLLPKLGEGEILQVDTGTEDSELVKLKEALDAIRQAQKDGRPVWLVIGNASGSKRKA
jgi:transcriptional regulator with XRE-family HTH domain